MSDKKDLTPISSKEALLAARQKALDVENTAKLEFHKAYLELVLSYGFAFTPTIVFAAVGNTPQKVESSLMIVGLTDEDRANIEKGLEGLKTQESSSNE